MFSFFKLILNLHSAFFLFFTIIFWFWFYHLQLFVWILWFNIKVLNSWSVLLILWILLSLIDRTIMVMRNWIHLHYLVNQLILHRIVSWLLSLLTSNGCCSIFRPADHVKRSDLPRILMNKSTGANSSHLGASWQEVDTHALLLVWSQVGVERVSRRLLLLLLFLLLFICPTKCAWEINLVEARFWSLLWIVLVTIHI